MDFLCSFPTYWGSKLIQPAPVVFLMNPLYPLPFSDTLSSKESSYLRAFISLMGYSYACWKQKQEKYDWSLQCRPEQKIPSGLWRTWLILAGRGYGKTRTGAETIKTWINQGKCRHVALIAKSVGEARHVMVEGESGLLSLYPESQRPRFYPSKRSVLWPGGARATLYSGDHPDQLRGPQFDGAWIDELAKYQNPRETWEQLNLALRLGHNPQVIITTTPRPSALLEELVEEAHKNSLVRLTQGSTYENIDNLSSEYASFLKTQYEGTLLGAQEIHGTLLRRRDHALWKEETLEAHRFRDPPPLQRIVVGVDPAATHTESSDETGIVVAGMDNQGIAYVLEDLSGRYAPREWSQRVVEAYKRYRADRVVAEVNKGGDMIEDLLRAHSPCISFKAVRATRGKGIRAEPIAALYEKGRVFHRDRGLTDLEQQLISYVPGRTSTSPDRLDALVWALTELMLRGEADVTPHAWIV